MEADQSWLDELHKAVTQTDAKLDREEWSAEEASAGVAFLVTPAGVRLAPMASARARGIAAALNTMEGRRAFEKALEE